MDLVCYVSDPEVHAPDERICADAEGGTTVRRGETDGNHVKCIYHA